MALNRPILRLLDGLVYSGQPLLIIAFVSELNGQLDKVDVGDSPVPGCSERLDQLAFDCRMSLDYLQGYSNLFCTRDSQSDSYPVIGWARSASWSCSGMHFQLVTMQFGTMTWLTVIL